MVKKFKKKKSDIPPAARVTLRAIRDSTDAFPLVKSAAAAVLVICEMSQKVKANKKDCKALACRATEIVYDISQQTNCYVDELPTEVQQSVDQIERIFHDIISFMKDFEDQKFFRRYARQDDNKGRIAQLNKLLDESIVLFGVNLQLSVHRLHVESSHCIKSTFVELDDVSRERHGEVLDISRMSEKERELLTQILSHARFRGGGHAFFF